MLARLIYRRSTVSFRTLVPERCQLKRLLEIYKIVEYITWIIRRKRQFCVDVGWIWIRRKANWAGIGTYCDVCVVFGNIAGTELQFE